MNPDGYARSAGRRFLGFLFTPSPSVAAYLLRSWPLAMVPGGLLVMAVSLIARLAGHPLPVIPRPKIGFFYLVILGPILETLMMVPVLWLLRRMFSSRLTAALLSAALWAVLHATESPAKGVSAIWGFFVLSSAFLGWRQRSLLAAFWVTCSLHVLNNLTVWTVLRSERAGGNLAGLMATALILGLMAGGVAFAPSLEARSRPSDSPQPGTGTGDAAPAVDPVAVDLARASWVLPIVGVAIAAWLEQAIGKGSAPGILVFLLAPVLGLLAGLGALVLIPMSGTRRVLAPALTGLLVNSLILFGALVAFLVRYTRESTAFHP